MCQQALSSLQGQVLHDQGRSCRAWLPSHLCVSILSLCSCDNETFSCHVAVRHSSQFENKNVNSLFALCNKSTTGFWLDKRPLQTNAGHSLGISSKNMALLFDILNTVKPFYPYTHASVGVKARKYSLDQYLGYI